jgi:hypothetical protein
LSAASKKRSIFFTDPKKSYLQDAVLALDSGNPSRLSSVTDDQKVATAVAYPTNGELESAGRTLQLYFVALKSC